MIDELGQWVRPGKRNGKTAQIMWLSGYKFLEHRKNPVRTVPFKIRTQLRFIYGCYITYRLYPNPVGAQLRSEQPPPNSSLDDPGKTPVLRDLRALRYCEPARH